MEKTLKYAVVGCGDFGNMHLHALSLITGIKVVALCDKYIEKCQERKKQYKLSEANCYTDYNEMLSKEDIDIVVVATSDKAHSPVTVAALKSGRHVICEKPMALFVEECEEMIKAADETGNLLMIGQVCRCAPGFVKAKEIVDSGLIGELYFVESEYAHDYSLSRGVDDWRVDKDREPIIGGACHAIDLLRWIAGDPTETTAYSNHKMLPDWPVPDTTIAILKFPNNVIGKIFTSIGCKRNYTMRTVLYGTKGTIIVDNGISLDLKLNTINDMTSAGSIEVKAGAAGKVFKLEASVGQSVKKGDAVLIIEAMKMEIPVVAPEDGTVASINVAVGDAIDAGTVLATLN